MISNGLKFRMPGLGGKALGKLGASVQNIPGSEVYQALSSGAIDGTEWIGPWADEKAGFQEITKVYYTAGFHEPNAGLSLATNRDVFDSLTPAQQKIIEIAAGECHQWNLSQFLANNGAALQRLQSGWRQGHGIPGQRFGTRLARPARKCWTRTWATNCSRKSTTAQWHRQRRPLVGWTCRQASIPRSVTAFAAKRSDENKTVSPPCVGKPLSLHICRFGQTRYNLQCN